MGWLGGGWGEGWWGGGRIGSHGCGGGGDGGGGDIGGRGRGVPSCCCGGGDGGGGGGVGGGGGCGGGGGGGDDEVGGRDKPREALKVRLICYEEGLCIPSKPPAPISHHREESSGMVAGHTKKPAPIGP